MAVCIQQMVRSDKGSSGVAFSIDPETGFEDVIVINGTWGLGELLVQGEVHLNLMNLLCIKRGSILSKKLGSKQDRIVYEGEATIKTDVSIDLQQKFCLEDSYIYIYMI